jgi:hypothetical protein
VIGISISWQQVSLLLRTNWTSYFSNQVRVGRLSEKGIPVLILVSVLCSVQFKMGKYCLFPIILKGVLVFLVRAFLSPFCPNLHSCFSANQLISIVQIQHLYPFCPAWAYNQVSAFHGSWFRYLSCLHLMKSLSFSFLLGIQIGFLLIQSELLNWGVKEELFWWYEFKQSISFFMAYFKTRVPAF